MAISGANFAVAETGTVMVVESEGNGRMCLTLPDTLITVMGIEKLVPRWQDLEVFLQLLPRSSTAERMNPYTSMWTGVTPGDGPQAFHLVLLDNGRTDTLADPVGRQALRCIRCSACLNVCPVYERTGGRAYGSPYPGPIGAILTPQLRGIHATRSTSRPRRCPTRRRCAARASRSAPSGSTSPRCSSTCGRRSSSQHGGGDGPRRKRVAVGVAGGTFAVPGGWARRSAGGLGGRLLAPRRAHPAAARAGARRWLRARPAGPGPRIVPALVAAGRR